MAININDNFSVNSGKSIDSKYGKVIQGKTVPYTSTDEANGAINVNYRYKGLTVLIDDGSGSAEYWYKTATDDGSLEIKSQGGELPTLASVAYSGNYNDLNNQPSIPSYTSQLINNSGFITSGISAVNGTTNQVNVGHSGNNVTLSLPQNIDTAAGVTFGSLTVSKAMAGLTSEDNVVVNPSFNTQANNLIRSALKVDPSFSDSSTGVGLYTVLGPTNGYTAGFFSNVPLTGGTGTGAKMYVAITDDGPDNMGYQGSFVQAVGTGYAAGDILTVPAGAWGDSFDVQVDSVGHLNVINLGIDSTSVLNRFGGGYLYSGNNNVGFGYALSFLGTRQTLFGAQVAPNLQADSQQNTAFGFGSVFHTRHGSYNVGMGDHALFSNVGGNNNTAIGTNAMGAADIGIPLFPGDNNTAIGYGALSHLGAGYGGTGAALNIALGANAGYNMGNGSRNIIIGTNIDLNDASDSDRLIIGSEGNKWIYGNNGKIGFGITSEPTATVHIKAGSTSAGSAPLKLSGGSLMSTPENGAIEYDGTHLYFSIGSTRTRLDQQNFADDALILGNYVSGTPDNYLVLTSNQVISFKPIDTRDGITLSIVTVDPTTADVSEGTFKAYKNITTNEARLWTNDGGTMKSLLFA